MCEETIFTSPTSLNASIEKLHSHGSDFHLYKECVVAHEVDATKFVDKIESKKRGSVKSGFAKCFHTAPKANDLDAPLKAFSKVLNKRSA